MARPRFSIGIDLGTTNCAMAFEAFDTAIPQSEVFLIPQWESLAGFSEASTLPSFLYLPSEEEAAQLPVESTRGAEWIPGRFARKRASKAVL
jgi:molecular chaperone DnaK (HSP70)